MDLELKDKWVKALRSGEYTQGFGHYKTIKENKISHCVLGVFIEVAPDKNLAFEIEDPVYNRLLQMNDVEKKSFYELADWIEENL